MIMMNINNIIYLCKLMDSDSHSELPKPMEQSYFKLHKPQLALVVDNTKKVPKRLSYNEYLNKRLKNFFGFIFDKADL